MFYAIPFLFRTISLKRGQNVVPILYPIQVESKNMAATVKALLKLNKKNKQGNFPIYTRIPIV